MILWLNKETLESRFVTKSKGAILMQEDVFKTIASHIVNTKYADIPQSAIDVTKMNLIDSLGTLVAGSSAEGCEILIDLVKEWGGKEESTIMIYGGKVPAHSAALVNSVMARALDFDDAEENGMHPSSALVPTALAMSEKLGGLHGQELLTAITLGADVSGRINFATLDYHGFDPTLTCNIFGTTTVAGKLLGLDENQMWNALGLAFNECSGTFQSNIDGVLSVRLNQGLASYEGIMCAIFAQRGISGVKNIGQGTYSYFHLYSNDKADLEHLTVDLGKKFYGEKTIFKRWPSCGVTLIATDLMVEIVEEESFETEDVESIIVTVGKFTYNLVGKDFEIGHNPQVDAQFSLQYAISNALLRKKPIIEHFTVEYILDNKIQELVNKVKIVLDTQVSPAGKDYRKTTLEVYLKDGRKISKTGLISKGHPDNPIYMNDIISKYQNNVRFAQKLPQEKTDQIITLVSNLENVSSTNVLKDLLVI